MSYYSEYKLLQICPGRFQPDNEEPGPGGCSRQCCGLPPLPRQARHRAYHGGHLLLRLCGGDSRD